jgi:hypothetical protein
MGVAPIGALPKLAIRKKSIKIGVWGRGDDPKFSPTLFGRSFDEIGRIRTRGDYRNAPL